MRKDEWVKSWKRFLISAGVLLVVILGITAGLDSTQFTSNFANALVAWGTLMLAFATFLLIRHSKEQENQRRKDEQAREKRDRQERWLNEITVWLRELENRTLYTVNWKDILKLEKTSVNMQLLRKWENILTDLDILHRETIDGEYFQKVAVILDSDFSSLIGLILSLLEQRRQLILDRSKYPPSSINELKKMLTLVRDDTISLEGLNLTERNLNTILMGRNAGCIKESLRKAIEKAVELKRNLL